MRRCNFNLNDADTESLETLRQNLRVRSWSEVIRRMITFFMKRPDLWGEL
jgi:hypothetical protein